MEKISEKIRETIKARGLTYRAAAELVGIDVGQLYRFMRDQRPGGTLSQDTIDLVCGNLGLELRSTGPKRKASKRPKV